MNDALQFITESFSFLPVWVAGNKDEVIILETQGCIIHIWSVLINLSENTARTVVPWKITYNATSKDGIPEDEMSDELRAEAENSVVEFVSRIWIESITTDTVH